MRVSARSGSYRNRQTPLSTRRLFRKCACPIETASFPFGHRDLGERTSSEIGAHHVHELIRTLSTLGSAYRRWTRQMAFDVLFHHLDHQAIDRASHRRDLLQHLGASELSLQRALERLNLAANATYPGQKLGLSTYRMTHETNLKEYVRDIVSEAYHRV